MTDIAASSRAPAADRAVSGRRLVIALFFMMTGAAGLVGYAVPAILHAFVDQMDLTVLEASHAIAWFYLISGAISLVVGIMLERWSARRMTLIAAALSSLALCALPLAHGAIEIELLMIALAVGFNFCGPVTGAILITRWFGSDRRPMMMAIAYTGLSVGGIALTPPVAWAIQMGGLTNTALPIGLAFWVCVFVPAWWGIRDHPPASTEVRKEAPAPSLSILEALQTRFFRMVILTFMLVNAGWIGGLAHLYSLAAERIGMMAAPLFLGFLSLGGVAGRFANILVLRYTDMRGATVFFAAAFSASLVLIVFSHTAFMLALTSMLFGLCGGALRTMQPLTLAAAYGASNYGRLYSFNRACALLGASLGPVLVGMIHNYHGDYDYAFLAMAGVSGLSIITILNMGPVPSSSPPPPLSPSSSPPLSPSATQRDAQKA